MAPLPTSKCPVDPLEDARGHLLNPIFDPDPIVTKADSVIESYRQKAKASAAFASHDVRVLLERRSDFLSSHRLRFLSFWANPIHMGNLEMLGTWERLEDFIAARQRELKVLISGGMQHLCEEKRKTMPSPKPSSEYKRYMAVVDALKHKKDLLAENSTPPFPFYVVGYFFVQWHIPGRHINLMHVRYEGRDSVDDHPSKSPILIMIASLSTRVMMDAVNHNHPEPDHVWCLGYKSSTEAEVRTRFMIQIEKFGFKPIGEYCEAFGYNQEDLEEAFESSTLPIEYRRELLVFVCRWVDVKAAAQSHVRNMAK
ncbi:hypothetical protein HDU67_000723 [Dinochytrium kinnereticum]|nr:hypothetical protein HDU67_000723 [Dinochytrium kinnereticum]